MKQAIKIESSWMGSRWAVATVCGLAGVFLGWQLPERHASSDMARKQPMARDDASWLRAAMPGATRTASAPVSDLPVAHAMACGAPSPKDVPPSGIDPAGNRQIALDILTAAGRSGLLSGAGAIEPARALAEVVQDAQAEPAIRVEAWAALQMLQEDQPRPQDAQAILSSAEQRGDIGTQQDVLEVLAGHMSADMVPVVARLLNSTDAELREQAAYRLAELPDDPVAKGALKAAVDRPETTAVMKYFALRSP